MQELRYQVLKWMLQREIAAYLREIDSKKTIKKAAQHRTVRRDRISQHASLNKIQMSAGL